MKPASLAIHEEKLRSAVEAQDFALAHTALQEYIACFRSCSRTLPEVENASKLLQWSLQLIKSQKAQIAEELMLFKRVFDAYLPERRSHTWRVDG